MKKTIERKYLAMTLFFVLLVAFIISNTFIVASASSLSSTDIFSDSTSNSSVLIHYESGKILYGKDQDKKVQVASITKLMTTLIALERIEEGLLSMDDMVLISSHAGSMEGSRVFLDEGSNYILRDLLKSVIVASANDSAVAIAEHIGGSEGAFVTLMNNRAKELEMKNTKYSNASGLNAPEQYSTAIDTTIVLKECGLHDLFNEDSKIWMEDFVHPSTRKTVMVNTNRLVKYYDNAINGKTGYTDEAGYCLASTAHKGDLKLLAVNLNSSSSANRFKENIELLNYGFSNFENKQVLNKDEILNQTLLVKGGKTKSISIKSIEDFYLVTKKGEAKDIKISFELNKNLKAPINVGDVVGKCIVTNAGKVEAEVDVISNDKVSKHSYFDIVDKIFEGWGL